MQLKLYWPFLISQINPYEKSIFTLLLLSSIIANAQFSKGDKYLGGNVNLTVFSSSANQNNPVFSNSGNSFGINVNTQNLKASNASTLQGFTLGIGFSNSSNKQNDPSTSNIKVINNGVNAGIGYMIRKYKPLFEKFFWYMEYDASVGYSYYWQNSIYQNNGNIKSHSSSYNANISALPALALKASDRFLVDINFGGLNTNYSYLNTINGHSNAFSLGLNFSSRITLGVLWKLKKSARS